MEDYIQHIGRAGRNGRISTVEMLHGPADFARYYGGKWIENLSSGAKATQLASTIALER